MKFNDEARNLQSLQSLQIPPNQTIATRLLRITPQRLGLQLCLTTVHRPEPQISKSNLGWLILHRTVNFSPLKSLRVRSQCLDSHPERYNSHHQRCRLGEKASV